MDDDLPLAELIARGDHGNNINGQQDNNFVARQGDNFVGHDNALDNNVHVNVVVGQGRQEEPEEFHDAPQAPVNDIPVNQPAAAAAAGNGMDAMAQVMAAAFRQALQNVQPHRDDRVPVPSFNGEGDVELFIQQFNEIANVSGWTPAVAVLKLRHALQGKAQPCGQGNTRAEIIANLRLRFGMSSSEARSRLSVIRRATGVTLAEHASNLKQLVRVGYSNVPLLTQQQLVADAFRRSAGHDSLHRHLLAIASDNVDDLVRAGNAYLQTFGSRGDRAHAVDMAAEVSSVQTSDKSELADLKEVVLSLQKEIVQLRKGQQAYSRPSAASRMTKPDDKHRLTSDKKSVKCFGCGQLGHIKRNCPKGQGN